MHHDNSPTKILTAKKITLVTIVLLLAIGLSAFYYINSRPTIAKAITSKIDFKIYVPTKNSPATLDKKSVKYVEDDKVVTYSLLLQNGKNIAVSQRLKPTDVEVNPEIKTPINLPTYRVEFKTGYGTARFDVWGEKRVISMLTVDNTWIIFNYSGVDEATAKEVASSLERI